MSTGPQVPPPHPHPRRPAWRLPPGACDAHVHVYGPASRFPYAPARPYTPNDAPYEHLAALHHHLGIDRAVYVQATVHGYDNAAILDAIARDPVRGRGVALVRTDVTDGALHALHGAGVRGVRFNFVRHLNEVPDTGAVLRLSDRLARLGWHVQLHMGPQDLLAHEAFLRQLACPFVIDHMGRTPVAEGVDQPACQLLLSLLQDPRAWVKLSGPERLSALLSQGPLPYGDVVPFAKQLLAAAPTRTVWGTDWPHPNVREMPDDGDLVDILPHCGDAAQLHRLLVENPASLYGFDPL